MTHWQRLTLSFDTVDPQFIDWVSYLLSEAGATGLDIHYAQDYLENHPNLFGEIALPPSQANLDHPVEIWAYYDDGVDQAQVVNQVQAQVEDQIVAFTWQTIEEENWQEAWMDFYEPEVISRYLTVVPAWLKESYQAKEDQTLIYLDPGLAFGTGNHPTTRLGGQALELYMQGGERVLDVGTGSGVLSLIAASLGASYVAGYDLDPQAISAAQENLQLQEGNRHLAQLVEDQAIHFAVNDLLKGVNHQCDIIVANILPHILVGLFDDAYRLLDDAGYLILGGILEDKLDDLLEDLYGHGFKLIQETQIKEWVCLVAVKDLAD